MDPFTVSLTTFGCFCDGLLSSPDAPVTNARSATQRIPTARYIDTSSAAERQAHLLRRRDQRLYSYPMSSWSGAGSCLRILLEVVVVDQGRRGAGILRV